MENQTINQEDPRDICALCGEEEFNILMNRYNDTEYVCDSCKKEFNMLYSQ